MHQLELVRTVDRYLNARVDVLVNGTRLAHLIAQVELQYGRTGGYGGMVWWWNRRHDTPFSGLPRSGLILMCTCGEPACSSLAAEVEVTDNEVVWRRFHRFGRERTWSYDEVGVFCFDRAAYQTEVARMDQTFPFACVEQQV